MDPVTGGLEALALGVEVPDPEPEHPARSSAAVTPAAIAGAIREAIFMAFPFIVLFGWCGVI
jgi:hypothetical protein